MPGSASDPYANPQTPEQSYDRFIRTYNSRLGSNVGQSYRDVGSSGALAQGSAGIPAQMVGLNNLYQLLLGQGRVDPRLLAQAQAQNSRSTQQQKDAARAGAAGSGFGRGGLSLALQSALGSAGANRAANLNYQDISDSYGRNQQNLGLLDQLVIQPTLGYASLGLGHKQSENQLKAAKATAIGSLFGSAAGALTGR